MHEQKMSVTPRAEADASDGGPAAGFSVRRAIVVRGLIDAGRAVRPPSRPLGNHRKVGDPGSHCAGCQVWYKNLDQITYAKLKLGQTGMQATYALVSPNVVRWITTLPF